MDEKGQSLNVVIPSYKRADQLDGYGYFEYAKYVIPESQEKDYLRNADASRLIVIPDEEDGNIAKKRNWILKNIPRPLIMLDDDVKSLMMCEGGEYFEHHGKAKERIRLTSEQALDVFINTANLAHAWGCPMFGFALNTDGRNYQQYKPFSLTQPILGPCSGHLWHDCEYDYGMDLKEDYDMSFQVLNKYRKILRSNKFAVEVEHANNAGGCVAYRSLEREKDAAKAIMRKWGKGIIKYPDNPKKLTDVLNGRVHIPIKGV